MVATALIIVSILGLLMVVLMNIEFIELALRTGESQFRDETEFETIKV